MAAGAEFNDAVGLRFCPAFHVCVGINPSSCAGAGSVAFVAGVILRGFPLRNSSFFTSRRVAAVCVRSHYARRTVLRDCWTQVIWMQCVSN